MDKQFPVRTNMFEPCELYMHREHLIALLEMNVASIEETRGVLDKTPELAAETDHALRQRQELLAWAQEQKGSMIYMALYPTSEEETLEPGLKLL